MNDRNGLWDSFELPGRWWIAGNPSNKVGGTLTFAPDSLSLALHGHLFPQRFLNSGALSDSGIEILTILGETSAGPCSLLNAHEQSSTVGSTDESIVSGAYLLMQHHCQDIDALRISSASYDWSSLADFFELSCIDFDNSPETKPDGSSVLTTKVTMPAPIDWQLSNGDVRLSLQHVMSMGPSRTRVKVEILPRLTLTPSSEQPLNWFLTRFWKLNQLFTLLTDQPVLPEHIRIRPGDDSLSRDCSLFYVTRQKALPRTMPWMLDFRFGHICDSFQSICEDWMGASNELLNAINLFTWGRRSDEPVLESRLLTLCQSLEAFSRATTAGEYLSTSRYDRISDILVRAIPSDVDPDHRESLKAKIRFGYEWSLRKRFKELLESLSGDSLKCVCKSPAQFRNGIVDTRNYLTHYTSDLRPRALSGAALYWACEKISLLLRILLLKHIGLPEQMIIERLRENGLLEQQQMLWHPYPEYVAET